jgi:tRNA (guanine37-N1)-methyltransferase
MLTCRMAESTLIGNGTEGMHFAVVSLFPEMIGTIGHYGVVGRALQRNLVTLAVVNPRDHAHDVHRTVDDRPYGGGPGMVMKFEPVAAALESAKGAAPDGCPVVYLSPQGRVFDQAMASRFSVLPGMVLLAGRYEGIDERLIESHIDEEVSLGDYVLSGGEIAAMAVIDAVIRLLPGVLGDDESAAQDSFVKGLLDYPHYTRPEVVAGNKVPDVLLSGDHAGIARWRNKQALGRTYRRRPDLLGKLDLTDEQQTLLDEYLKEQRQ